jgi:cyanophycinase
VVQLVDATGASGKLPPRPLSALVAEHITPSFERPVRPRFLFGGGPPNTAALQEFWRLAGGPEARIIVIGWGSTVSDEYYERFRGALTTAVAELAGRAGDSAEHFSVSTVKMPDINELNGDVETPIRLLQEATAVFFLGGDQVRLMRALNATGIGEVVRGLIDAGALVHAGTSAGTAIGSRAMIGGYGEPPEDLPDQGFTRISHSRINADGQNEDRSFFVGEGLAVVPDHVLIEQHLSRDGRRQRFEHAVATLPHIEWGVGIDDSMAALWSDEGLIKAIGPTGVSIIRKHSDGTVEEVVWLQHGQVFDLSVGRVVLSSEVALRDD